MKPDDTIWVIAENLQIVRSSNPKQQDLNKMKIYEGSVLRLTDTAVVFEATAGSEYFIGKVSHDGIYKTKEAAEKALFRMKLSNKTNLNDK